MALLRVIRDRNSSNSLLCSSQVRPLSLVSKKWKRKSHLLSFKEIARSEETQGYLSVKHKEGVYFTKEKRGLGTKLLSKLSLPFISQNLALYYIQLQMVHLLLQKSQCSANKKRRINVEGGRWQPATYMVHFSELSKIYHL